MNEHDYIEQVKLLGIGSRHHPVWALSRLIVMALLAGGCLAATAQHLDSTELKSWLGIVGGMALREFGGHAVSVFRERGVE